MIEVKEISLRENENNNEEVRGMRFKVERGYIEAPIYETHRRGKNWMAILKKGKAPRKPEREFQEKEIADGTAFYPIQNVHVGDILEFGADYITSGGHREGNRKYFRVLEKEEDYIEVEEIPDYSIAVDLVEASQESELVKLYEERERLRKELNKVQQKIEELEAKQKQ